MMMVKSVFQSKRLFLSNAPQFTLYRAHRKTPYKSIAPGDTRPDDVTVYIFHDLRCVTIYETGIVEEEAQILFQNHKELKERSRTQQWNATSDIAFDHLDSLDAARDQETINL